MDENNNQENLNKEIQEKDVEYIIQDENINKKEKSKGLLYGIIGGLVGSIITIVIVSIMFLPEINNVINKETAETPISKLEFGEYENPVVAIAETVGPSIVGITVESEYSSFFGTQKSTQEGSGIIFKSDGYILTNNHVISTTNAINTVIKVYLPNSTEYFEAKVIGTDAQTDMAVIKIDCTDLPAVEFGNSSDSKVGELVVAIGNPLGQEFAGTVTVGYISALDRKLTDDDGTTFNLIQTDAAINTGNSGGALVNAKGQVIGINTVKIQGSGIEGICFAIPIDDVREIINGLVEYGKVKRPYIGIGGITIDEEIAKKYNLVIGVYVQSIETFSSAEKAGIKIGDVITKIDGEKIETMEQLNEIKNKHQIGDKLKITINRDEKEMSIDLTLQEQ